METSKAFKLGGEAPSLHPDSKTVYQWGHVRRCDKNKLRFQGMKAPGLTWEDTVMCSPALAEWISKLPHTEKSVANTETTYVQCRFRQDDTGSGKVRVQVEGPTDAPSNRPWGVEFIVQGHNGAKGMPKKGGAGPTSPGIPPSPVAFHVGDKVKIVKKGDAMSAGHNGPKIGDTATVASMTSESTYGTVVLAMDKPWGNAGGDSDVYLKWVTTPAHIAHVKPPEPVYQIGDKVVIVETGDGCNPPCSGGPSVGTVGVISKFWPSDTDADGKPDCGSLVVKFDAVQYSDEQWTTTPAHIAHMDPVKLLTSQTGDGVPF